METNLTGMNVKKAHADLRKGSEIACEFFRRGIKKSPELERAWAFMERGLQALELLEDAQEMSCNLDGRFDGFHNNGE